jgi:hypothetical protein
MPVIVPTALIWYRPGSDCGIVICAVNEPSFAAAKFFGTTTNPELPLVIPLKSNAMDSFVPNPNPLMLAVSLICPVEGEIVRTPLVDGATTTPSSTS